MEWLREENRRLTRMTMLSGIALVLGVIGAIPVCVSSGPLPLWMVAVLLLLAFIAGSARATELAVVAACDRIRQLENRVAALEKELHP
jgi:hypothetical protein